jgi:hypothetical protein
MERVKGFEPSASSLARKRSSQLSYTRIWPETDEVPLRVEKVNYRGHLPLPVIMNIRIVDASMFYV